MKEETYYQEPSGTYVGTGERWSCVRAIDGFFEQQAWGIHVTLDEAKDIAEDEGMPFLIFAPAEGRRTYMQFDESTLKWKRITLNSMAHWTRNYTQQYHAGLVR